MKIFLICPVRLAGDIINKVKLDNLERWVATMEERGHEVHYPARDTKQDQRGYPICSDNIEAIATADVIAIYYDPDSNGSKFDLGAAFALGKPIYPVNPQEILDTEHKSFSQMICDWYKVNGEDLRC